MSRRNAAGTKGLPETPLQSVPQHRPPRDSDRETEARRSTRVEGPQRVDSDRSRDYSAALAEDTVELPRTPYRLNGIHERRRKLAYADNRARPLARLFLRMVRPALVFIRARKPCLRFRLRVLGWKVRLVTKASNRFLLRLSFARRFSNRESLSGLWGCRGSIAEVRLSTSMDPLVISGRRILRAY